eukprot:CAMPEP_0115603804 /NCGR_PEP_ID=MMETSP0272-20121206/16617_1 /TAXON_ID=71861 /ORGANISM="Scrippsiella trochoidea, Strain CCMP3099" /LENGTH=266 /DNA_ID=CAMNT_0003039339 /DNA_START=128 /DNA_END=926 /DNA_ORIENTATION=+
MSAHKTRTDAVDEGGLLVQHDAAAWDAHEVGQMLGVLRKVGPLVGLAGENDLLAGQQRLVEQVGRVDTLFLQLNRPEPAKEADQVEHVASVDQLLSRRPSHRIAFRSHLVELRDLGVLEEPGEVRPLGAVPGGGEVVLPRSHGGWAEVECAGEGPELLWVGGAADLAALRGAGADSLRVGGTAILGSGLAGDRGVARGDADGVRGSAADGGHRRQAAEDAVVHRPAAHEVLVELSEADLDAAREFTNDALRCLARNAAAAPPRGGW